MVCSCVGWVCKVMAGGLVFGLRMSKSSSAGESLLSVPTFRVVGSGFVGVLRLFWLEVDVLGLPIVFGYLWGGDVSVDRRISCE